jgi:hypothetical protein
MTAPGSRQLSATVSEWLPDSAVVAASVLAAIDARVAAWSARWFARPVRRQQGGGQDSGGTPVAVAVNPLARHGWRGFGPGIWLDWGGSVPQVLALQALGRAELRPKLSPDDERLAEMLGERLACDLAASLVEAPVRSLRELDGEPTRAVCFKLVGAGQNAGVGVAIDITLLAGLRKQQCPPWRAVDARTRPLAAAVGGVPVAFEVSLGRVRVGLLEFEAIEPGDTLVLDQPVAAPIAVRAAATRATIRDARLVHQDEQLTLTAS